MTIPRLVFSALLCAVGFAQSGDPVNVWMPRGPEGGSVGRLTVDPQNPATVYAGAGGRLYRTTDAGGHWSVVSSPSVTVLAVDPRNSSTLYGADGEGLFKSTDGGVRWNASGAGLPCPCYVPTLAIDPGNSSVLYAAFTSTSGDVNGGVFKSTDGGATWAGASAGLPVYELAGRRPYSAMEALAIDPADPRTLYAAPGLILSAGGGVYKSTDGAATWSAVNSGLPDSFFIGSLAIDPRNPGTLYLSSQGALYKSTDGGANWTARMAAFSGRKLAVDPQDSATIYAVGQSGVMKSGDGGGSWSVVFPDVTLTGGTVWLAVAGSADGASTIYVGDGLHGIFRSPDGGLTWAAANSGVIGTWIDWLAIDPQNPRALYAGVFAAGLFKSTDGAASWSAAPLLPATFVFGLAFEPGNPATLYASATGGVSKSIDGGASWVRLPLNVEAGFPVLAVDAGGAGTVYVGGYRSGDGGASWTKLATLPGIVTAVAADPQNSGTIYAGSVTALDGSTVSSISSGVLKSVDGVKSWSGVNTLWHEVTVAAVAVDPADAGVVYAQTDLVDCSYIFCGPDYTTDPEVAKVTGLFRSVDGGASWAKLETGDGSRYVTLLGVDQRGTVYAQGQSALVRSRDGGVTWEALPAGLPSRISALAFDAQDPNHLFAGTYGSGGFEITLAPQ